MRTSIATVSLSGSLTEKLTAASRAGFDGVEIFENDLLASPLTPEEIRARCADLGLTIDLYQPMRDIEAVPADEFARNLRRARHKFELMRRLGADTVLVCSSVSPHAVDDDDLAADQLQPTRRPGRRSSASASRTRRSPGAATSARTTTPGASSRPPTTPRSAPAWTASTSSPRGPDPKGIEDIPGEKIFFLQLADAPLLAMDVLQWSRHYRCFPGQGGFDVAGLVRRVLRAGYDGPLSLEVFNDVFRQADAGPTAVDAQRSLLVLQETVGLATLPAPVAPTGVAFAELVTPDAEPVSAVLGALGFARTARHRSKPVDLWQQGEARILVNTVGRRPPGRHRTRRVGLESPDPTRRRPPRRGTPRPRPAAPPRAGRTPRSTRSPHPTARNSSSARPQRHGLPELARRLRRTSNHEAGAPGVQGIDHLALTQPWHHFDEATLFHRSVLGLHAQESVDVADPYGLMRSRAVTNADGRVRIALSVGAAPTDDTVHAQHLALATDDVVAAARRFREAGGRLLPIPANYYDDLAARYEFADGELETYRELGILYDRDAHGEFRHCYTVTVGRVFFELVQRDGYRGYGAQNAPVRLAAQHAGRPVR